MVDVFRAQVPVDRFVLNQWVAKTSESDGQFREIKGIRDNVETRVWALLGTVESLGKAAVAGVAFLVSKAVNRFFANYGTHHAIYKDVAQTQFDSFWRCALAVYSPSKSLARTLAGEGEERKWVIAQEKQKWGTAYAPGETRFVDKCKPWTLPAAPVTDPLKA